MTLQAGSTSEQLFPLQSLLGAVFGGISGLQPWLGGSLSSQTVGTESQLLPVGVKNKEQSMGSCLRDGAGDVSQAGQLKCLHVESP